MDKAAVNGAILKYALMRIARSRNAAKTRIKRKV
jgi:hypothetical protein